MEADPNIEKDPVTNKSPHISELPYIFGIFCILFYPITTIFILDKVLLKVISTSFVLII
jgi:hypothetical protein